MFSKAANLHHLKYTSIYQRLRYVPNYVSMQNKIFCSSCPCDTSSSSSSGGKFRVTYKPYVKPCEEDHDHKNMRLKRPMSPHLEIYAPTLPAMVSIVQRITGTLLVFYALMLSVGAVILPNGIDSYVYIIQSFGFGRMSVFILKILLGAPFAFHYANGIRFALWNAGKTLSLKESYDTARKAFILTAIVTFFFSLR